MLMDGDVVIGVLFWFIIVGRRWIFWQYNLFLDPISIDWGHWPGIISQWWYYSDQTLLMG